MKPRSPGRRLGIFLLSLLSLLIGAPAFPAGSAAPGGGGELAAMAASLYPPDVPGAAMLLARGDEVLLRQGRGLASVELGVPIEPGMVFRIGSITKQFTAVAILRLAEQGKLRLDQKISEILPDYPQEQGAQVKVENLLSHTGGIPDYTQMPEFWNKSRLDLAPADMYAFFANLPLRFPPGERFEYSNSGYYVLGKIVEKVSGESYADFVQQHLFGPAGMKASLYDDPQKLVPRRVAGYVRLESGEYVPAPFVSLAAPFSAGALASTVDDLHRWNEALLAGKLVSRASLEKAWTPYTFTDGKKSHYGFGWNLGTWNGRRVVHHGGGIHGFFGALLFFPDQRITAVVLSNGNGLNPNLLAQRLAMAAFGEKSILDTVVLSQAALQKFEGIYQISESSRRTVRAKDGKIFTSRDGSRPIAASPISATEFAYDLQNDRLRFEVDASGNVTRMLMLRWGDAVPEVAEKTGEKLPEEPKFVVLPATDADKLAGIYQLATDFQLTVRRKGEGLTIQGSGQSELAASAVSPTEIFVPLVGARLVFELAGGKAKSLTLYQGGEAQTGKRID